MQKQFKYKAQNKKNKKMKLQLSKANQQISINWLA